jgi:hypothetical protein
MYHVMPWPQDVPTEHRAGLQLGGTPSHDPDLGVADPTWKAALLALAAKIFARYGDDRVRATDLPPAARRE